MTAGQQAMRTHVVVGAGQAGAHAAVAMRRAGFGGRIVLIGEEASLPYDRPPLSKSFLLAEDEPRLTHFFEPAVFSSLRIEAMVGVKVEAIDLAARRIALTYGGGLDFDALLLATGSRPRCLNVPGGERGLAIRTFDDASQLRQRLIAGQSVVCIGAGVIGLEVAAAAQARGCSVSVLDVERTVMSRSLAPELGVLVQQLHEHHGVTFEGAVAVAAIEGDSVVLGDGRRLPADTVVCGIGVVRNIDLARAAGIATRAGILVDPYGRTSADGIYAAGEVAEFPLAGGHGVWESWKHAQDHGALVGRVMAGAAQPYNEVPWFWSDQYGVNIQVVGDATGAAAAQVVDRGKRDGPSFCAFFLDAQSHVIGAFGWNAPKEVAAATRMIRRAMAITPDRLADPSVSLQTVLATSSSPAVAQLV
ncbi:p-cumate 2,3-dioxygenase ferredoxin reductase subunit [Chelatococcus asaccharovorans]|uniref:p-cumate 2,3-dioxygenase ferredoxin reductase subunit n=2 Tax=Chelatococcus asaccharovorans TaxID=28210 RepID=A0A2V3URV4_9HYPH|nr:p-cumate 2,3-dioxygenase ferredoxin reductase subunit [Chelatococcus asaccharovorans]